MGGLQKFWVVQVACGARSVVARLMENRKVVVVAAEQLAAGVNASAGEQQAGVTFKVDRLKSAGAIWCSMSKGTPRHSVDGFILHSICRVAVPQVV